MATQQMERWNGRRRQNVIAKLLRGPQNDAQRDMLEPRGPYGRHSSRRRLAIFMSVCNPVFSLARTKTPEEESKRVRGKKK